MAMKDRSCPRCGVDIYKLLALLSCVVLFVSVVVFTSGLFFKFWLINPLMISSCFIFGLTFLGLAIAGAYEFDQKKR